ncbi:MAG: hypothetical protein U9N19_03345 [Thermodesulfobacteriota bacterium]|nr:hypothetical protein [Thermodesulfobacteriota bacterium]
MIPLAIEERVDTLKSVFGEFIVSTNKAFFVWKRPMKPSTKR